MKSSSKGRVREEMKRKAVNVTEVRGKDNKERRRERGKKGWGKNMKNEKKRKERCEIG